MVISGDSWHSHLLPSVWGWSCHYLFLWLRSVATGIRKPKLPLARQTLKPTAPPPRYQYFIALLLLFNPIPPFHCIGLYITLSHALMLIAACLQIFLNKNNVHFYPCLLFSLLPEEWVFYFVLLFCDLLNLAWQFPLTFDKLSQCLQRFFGSQGQCLDHWAMMIYN